MSDTLIQTQDTDSTNIVPENSVAISVEPVLNETIQNQNDQVFDDPQSEPNPTDAQQPQPTYAVVLFAKYKNSPRPSDEDLIAYFSKYGTVDHVVCPENAIYAFIFMSSLSTDAEHRRTRTTISQIISDMDPNNRFHITVASSNRDRNQSNRGRGQRGRGRGARPQRGNPRDGPFDTQQIQHIQQTQQTQHTQQIPGQDSGRPRGRGRGRPNNESTRSRGSGRGGRGNRGRGNRGEQSNRDSYSQRPVYRSLDQYF